MYPLTPNSMMKKKIIGNGISKLQFLNEKLKILNEKFEFVQKFFLYFIIELGVGGFGRSGTNFVENKSVHVIAKHRRVKFVDSKNSMQKCVLRQSAR